MDGASLGDRALAGASCVVKVKLVAFDGPFNAPALVGRWKPGASEGDATLRPGMPISGLVSPAPSPTDGGGGAILSNGGDVTDAEGKPPPKAEYPRVEDQF